MNGTRIRRHGFAGQHLVVVPDPVRRQARDHPLLQGLHVTDAGYFPRATSHRVERPLGAATDLIIACLQGEGWVRTPERSEPVHPGDVVWLAADHAHAYGAAETDPWTIVWVHSAGDELPHWRRELGWGAGDALGTLHVTANRVPELGLDQAYHVLEHGYSVPHMLAAAAALRTAFCTLLELRQDGGAPRSAAERITRVRDQLLRTSARNYRLDELAAAAGLSVPHFSLLFRKQTGFAPIDFLIRQRIRAACQLLDTTPISVAAIAEQVGFQDPYYFSRCFRRVMGRSPLAYRKAVKA
ncbi:AraC family transcriptional regulator [Opitutus sp. ER46]|uniref:AraC family transcriptional regulator n=1 Tax=Opitutus sp. ER46 TaxID=2161864 RepID=UPI0013049AD3|nr:AraC family transcriptional regulator [Opitutus sp. ER46]